MSLRASRRYGRYLKLTAKGALIIDEAKIKAAEHLDGKFVVHSNDDTLTAQETWRSVTITSSCNG